MSELSRFGIAPFVVLVIPTYITNVKNYFFLYVALFKSSSFISHKACDKST